MNTLSSYPNSMDRLQREGFSACCWLQCSCVGQRWATAAKPQKSIMFLGNRSTPQPFCEEGNKTPMQAPGDKVIVYLNAYKLTVSVSWLSAREIIQAEGFLECEWTWLTPHNSASPKTCNISSLIKLPVPVEKQTTHVNTGLHYSISARILQIQRYNNTHWGASQ